VLAPAWSLAAVRRGPNVTTIPTRVSSAQMSGDTNVYPWLLVMAIGAVLGGCGGASAPSRSAAPTPTTASTPPS